MLCPACDHRIKGHPHCQDCIVAGIDMLRRSSAGRQKPVSRDEKSAMLALILDLVPGLGAAYNEQNVKAMVHFIVAVGLMTLSDAFDWPLEIAFGLGGVTFYGYSLYDAFSSAQRLRNGEDLRLEDEHLKSVLRARTNVLGVFLITIGGLAAFNIAFPQIVRRFWPLLLVGAGVYFIRNYHLSRKDPEMRMVYRTPPPSVVPPGYDRPTSDFVGAKSRYDR